MHLDALSQRHLVLTRRIQISVYEKTVKFIPKNNDGTQDTIMQENLTCAQPILEFSPVIKTPAHAAAEVKLSIKSIARLPMLRP